MRSPLPLSSLSAAIVAIAIGFGGTVALIVQAGQALGANPLQITSMVTALALGIGIPGAVLSWKLRMPVVLAWSTPGAALLAATTAGYSWPSAVGAFIVAALLMVVTGLVPSLGRAATRIPSGIAAGMLAGVLLPFCIKLVMAAQIDLASVLVLLAAYLLMRRLYPTWALPAVLVIALAMLALRGQMPSGLSQGLWGQLAPVTPSFDWKAMIGLAIPLYLVTLASQNLPGLVVLRAAGFEPPANRLVFWSGFASVLAAPFGAHGVNLAAITAAICTSEEAHPDKSQRWKVGVAYGILYSLVALFAAPLAALFIGMPTHILAAVTGLALIAPLTSALVSVIDDQTYREPAILTFIVTASGLSLFGVGAAFWGLICGFAALVILRRPAN